MELSFGIGTGTMESLTISPLEHHLTYLWDLRSLVESPSRCCLKTSLCSHTLCPEGFYMYCPSISTNYLFYVVFITSQPLPLGGSFYWIFHNFLVNSQIVSCAMIWLYKAFCAFPGGDIKQSIPLCLWFNFIFEIWGTRTWFLNYTTHTKGSVRETQFLPKASLFHVIVTMYTTLCYFTYISFGKDNYVWFFSFIFVVYLSSCLKGSVQAHFSRYILPI